MLWFLALSLFSTGPTVDIIPVTVTAYNAEVAQTDSTPFITASNKRVREGIVALSRDLERDYGLTWGDKVYIIGIGEFEFQDRMNRRFKKRVDIFMWSKRRALKFGKKKAKLIIKWKEK